MEQECKEFICFKYTIYIEFEDNFTEYLFLHKTI